MEGVCMIASNSDSMSFAVMNLRGTVSVYKVKNADTLLIDSCTLQWQVSIADVLKVRSGIDSQGNNTLVFVKYIQVVNDGTVIALLTD